MNCTQCGKYVDVSDADKKRGRGKFCGHACYHEHRKGLARPHMRKRITKVCVVCHTEFETGGRAGKLDKDYCSWECRYKARYRRSEKALVLSEAESAYIAGFVDGEGSILLYLRRDTASLRLSISNTKRHVLEWISERTGLGSIITREHENLKHATSHNWQVNSEGAESVIEQIRPYMIIKTRQADLGLTVQSKLRNPALKADREWQKAAVIEMKLLNKRGPQ